LPSGLQKLRLDPDQLGEMIVAVGTPSATVKDKNGFFVFRQIGEPVGDPLGTANGGIRKFGANCQGFGKWRGWRGLREAGRGFSWYDSLVG